MNTVVIYYSIRDLSRGVNSAELPTYTELRHKGNHRFVISGHFNDTYNSDYKMEKSWPDLLECGSVQCDDTHNVISISTGMCECK